MLETRQHIFNTEYSISINISSLWLTTKKMPANFVDYVLLIIHVFGIF